jgi:hypothetical protein
MDQAMLVETHKEDGKRLIERLVETGIPVTTAAWLKDAETGYWHLYIASPIINEEAPVKPVYRRVNEVKRQMPQPFWIGPGEITLISPSDRIAMELAELQQRYTGDRPIQLGYGESQLGGMTISGAYIYPPTPASVS